MIDIKNKIVSITALIINIVLFIMELVAMIICIIKYGPSTFQYYTVLSNVLTMFSSLFYSIYYFINKGNTMPYWVQLIRYMGSNCLALTFVVVFTVLIPLSENGFHRYLVAGVQPFHHVICPILSVISYGLLEDGIPSFIDAIIATSPTLLYAIVTIILNLTKVLEGPYPFLKVYEQPFYMSIIWFFVIVGVSFALALLIKLLVIHVKKADNKNENENTTEDIEMV